MSASEPTPQVSFESVIIETDKAKNNPIDITLVTTDIDVFEHIDKPYLTGIIAFTDTIGSIAAAGIGSGDRVTIKFKSARKESKLIVKQFYIGHIISSDKPNDKTEHFILHLVEDIQYLSALKNINASYSGKCVDIIKTISDNSIKKDIEASGKDIQQMKVIVPNMTPLDAMSWIKNRATTVEGFPFYLYSTLVGDTLKFNDLKSMIEEPPMFKVAFTHIEGNMPSAVTASETGRRRTIIRYDGRGHNDILSMVRAGIVGAKYEYLNITQKTKHEFDFDIAENVIDNALGEFTKGRKTTKYDPTLLFHEEISRRITRMGTTKPYDGDTKSYSESTTGKYKLNVVNHAMEEMFKSEPMNIVVNGIDFMDGVENSTLGRKIPIKFLKNTTDSKGSEVKSDPIKSGDYIIYACKHSFRKELYTVTLSCLKLFNGEGPENASK